MKLSRAALAASSLALSLAGACCLGGVAPADATTYTQVTANEQSAVYLTATDSFTAAACTDAIPFMGTDITEQLGGTATSLTATLQRSPTDPSVSPSWTMIDTFSGAPAALAPNSYHEPGYAWWRVCVTAVGGGPVTIAQSGRRG